MASTLTKPSRHARNESKVDTGQPELYRFWPLPRLSPGSLQIQSTRVSVLPGATRHGAFRMHIILGHAEGGDRGTCADALARGAGMAISPAGREATVAPTP
jgi:hypothetical protein